MSDHSDEMFPPTNENNDGGMNVRRPNKKASERLALLRQKTSKVNQLDIEDIISYWMKVMDKKKRPKLNERTSYLVGAAIHDYGVETCKKAIDGCSYSDFHMGRNKQKVVYNTLELIFRNAENTERFAGYAS